jgi:outer membrane protein assembly factor BamC
MKAILRIFLILASSCLLSGCLFGSDGYIHNRENGYLQSKSIAPTQLPPTASTVKLETTYPVPEGPLPSGTTPISIIPPGMPVATEPVARGVAAPSQLLTNLQLPTLKINSAYSKAWDAVNAQLAALGYQVLGADKVTGVIEVKAANSVYQFNLEKYKNITLVTVLDQQGQAADSKVSTSMLEQLAVQLNK